MRLALLACLLSPWPVLADCPGPAEMGRGVVAGFDDGTEATIRRRPDGVVEWDRPVVGEEGAVVRTLLAQGFWQVEVFDLGPEGPSLGTGRELWHYPVEAGELPPPAPGLIWRGWATPEFDGHWLRSTWMDVTARAGAPVEVGGCAYAAWEVTTGFGTWTEGPRLLVTRYLPELGWGWVAEELDGDGAPVSRALLSLRAAD